MAHAVHAIHSLGFAHLDIKLENILLDEFFNIKVADMGSSISVAETAGLTDRKRGTLMYMAPEVAGLQAGEQFAAQAADIYSLGVTLFVLMTGQFPSPRETKITHSTVDSEGRTTTDCDMEDGLAMKYGCDKLSNDAMDIVMSMIQTDP
mmetsp:Transcript_41058/g.47239  ORF Transcript_41058/g.47239 Transcript_41058/m.47239 type:complete len:149 (-) Transcript_41058:402-848(-)